MATFITAVWNTSIVKPFSTLALRATSWFPFETYAKHFRFASENHTYLKQGGLPRQRRNTRQGALQFILQDKLTASHLIFF